MVGLRRDAAVEGDSQPPLPTNEIDSQPGCARIFTGRRTVGGNMQHARFGAVVLLMVLMVGLVGCGGPRVPIEPSRAVSTVTLPAGTPDNPWLEPAIEVWLSEASRVSGKDLPDAMTLLARAEWTTAEVTHYRTAVLELPGLGWLRLYSWPADGGARGAELLFEPVIAAELDPKTPFYRIPNAPAATTRELAERFLGLVSPGTTLAMSPRREQDTLYGPTTELKKTAWFSWSAPGFGRNDGNGSGLSWHSAQGVAGYLDSVTVTLGGGMPTGVWLHRAPVDGGVTVTP